jgi:hypothetical protein
MNVHWETSAENGFGCVLFEKQQLGRIRWVEISRWMLEKLIVRLR